MSGMRDEVSFRCDGANGYFRARSTNGPLWKGFTCAKGGPL